MWYFAWVLGASLAVLLAVVNTMHLEARSETSNTPFGDR